MFAMEEAFLWRCKRFRIQQEPCFRTARLLAASTLRSPCEGQGNCVSKDKNSSWTTQRDFGLKHFPESWKRRFANPGGGLWFSGAVNQQKRRGADREIRD